MQKKKMYDSTDSSPQFTESTNNLLYTSRLKYLFKEFYKIISLEGNKLSTSLKNCKWEY